MDLDDLDKLDCAYQKARQICDPIDFAQRQKNLVYAICDYLLRPINEIKEKEMKETGEALEKFFNIEKNE